ncbi:MCP four helix bundle domain-containing protein, partial [Vibrio parahaemolyticus]
MKLSNLSIKYKISALILIISLSVIALSVFFTSEIKMIEGKLTVFSETTVPSVLLVKNTEIELGILRKDEFSLLTNVNHPQFMEWVAGLEKSEQKIDKYLDQYEKGLWDQRDRDAFNKVKSAWVKYSAFNNEYAKLLLNNKIDEANETLLNGFSTFTQLSDAIRDLVELNQTYVQEDIASAHEAVRSAI